MIDSRNSRPNGNTAILYVIIGILVGVVIMLVIDKLPPRIVMAAAKTDTLSGETNGIIAISTRTRSENDILWVLDTNTKALVIYEFTGEDHIKYKTSRYVGYDLNMPDGVAYPDRKDIPTDLTPSGVKKAYDDIRKKAQ